ncbi:MAG TPA: RNA 2',3'-cyclic phosphodiesterase [Actinomycetota bacterium]
MARDRASRPEAKPLRLFVAVDVPEPVRDRVQAAIGPWREHLPRARWVPKQNQHITLKFLGSTWPRLVDWVIETVEGVARQSEPFETRVTGLGAFPSTRRARVLWARLDDPDGRLASLAADLEGRLAKEFTPEKRAFSAHLTMARFDPPVSLDEEEIAAADVVSEPFTVDRLVVYRSHLRRPAPIYEPVGEFALGSRGD